MTIRNLTKSDTLVLKGIAILSILMHNLLHWTEPLNSKENEFWFIKTNVYSFFQAFSDSPWDFFNIIMSYLGHYGVQMFIFISGFGLALSISNKPKTYGTFILDRLKKIYPLVIIAFVFYFFSTIIMNYRLVTLQEMRSFGYKFLFIHTFIPKEGLSVCGPWWFFGLIMQLYLLFPLIYKLIIRYNIKAFLIICLISYSLIYLEQFSDIFPNDFFILQNFPGHLPEFCLGILFVNNKGKKIHPILFFVALAIFCLGNFYKGFFPLTFLCISYVIICAYTKITEWSKGKIFGKGFFEFFGSLSMVLFATHGEFRWQFAAMALEQNNAGYTTLMLILFLITAVLIALSANVVYKKILALLQSKEKKRSEDSSNVISN